MKEAVYARHHLAAAHADYCRSLRLTGSALSTFAAGEQLSVSDQTPAVFLHQTNPSSTIPIKPSPSPSLHAPPPPPPIYSSSETPSPAPSKPPQPPQSLPRIVNAPPKRRRKPPKLPHILSESSPSSSPRSDFSNNYFPTAYQANSTYSSTPSQASSVWNWENFYPPSPPDSEFFNRRAHETQIHNNQNQNHHLDTDPESEPETERSEYDFFQPNNNSTSNRYNHYNHDPNPNPKLNPFRKNHNVDDETEEREEVQCSEWGDHYSTTTSSGEEDEELDKDSRSDLDSMDTRSNFRSNSVKQPPPPQPQYQQPVYTNNTKKSDDVASSSSFRTRTSEISNMKMVVRHKDLKEIVDALKENFDRAADAGDQLTGILEIGRAQLDRSFSQLKSKVFDIFLNFYILFIFKFIIFEFPYLQRLFTILVVC